MIQKIQTLIYLVIASVMLFTGAGCSRGGSNTAPYVAPVEDQEFAGVWLGAFWEDYSSVHTTTFSTSIITQDGQAVLMNADGTQYMADGTSTYFSAGGGWILGYGQLFETRLLVNVWDTTGDDYYCDTGYFDSEDFSQYFGSIATKSLLWCLFEEEEEDYAGGFSYIYNTTYEVPPNVNDLEGTWVASNVFMKGSANTLGLTITPAYLGIYTSRGIITGGDSFDNIFIGTISIHYTEEDEIEGNIYDVTLTFDGIDMEGFASYVQEVDTEGIVIDKKTLLLGVSKQVTSDWGYMINVLSTMVD